MPTPFMNRVPEGIDHESCKDVLDRIGLARSRSGSGQVRALA